MYSRPIYFSSDAAPCACAPTAWQQHRPWLLQACCLRQWRPMRNVFCIPECVLFGFIHFNGHIIVLIAMLYCHFSRLT